MELPPVTLFTGTRRDLSAKERTQIRADFDLVVEEDSIVIHGDCPTGVDAEVREICRTTDKVVFESACRAPWNGYKARKQVRKAGHKRNEFLAYQLMLYHNVGHPCRVMAYPNYEHSPGTYGMLDLVQEHLPVRVTTTILLGDSE